MRKILKEESELTVPQIMKRALRLTQDAANRASEYYSNNTDELVEDIKENVKESIYVASILPKGDSFAWDTWEKINL